MKFIKFIILIIIVFAGFYLYQEYFPKNDLSEEQLQIRSTFGTPDQFVVAYIPEKNNVLKRFDLWFYIAHHKKFYFLNGENMSNEEYEAGEDNLPTSLRPDDFSGRMKFSDVAGILGALNIKKIYPEENIESTIQMYESSKAVFIVKNNNLLYLQTKGVDDENNQLINSDIIKIFIDQGKTEGVELIELLISKSLSDIEKDYSLGDSYMNDLKNKAFNLLNESKDSGKALIGENVGVFMNNIISDFIENVEKQRASSTGEIKEPASVEATARQAINTFEMTKKKGYQPPLNISGCKNGYYFDPQIGCLQKDCDSVAGTYVDDDGRCVCKLFGCYRAQDYEECPSCVYACMDQEGVCP